MAIAPPDPPSGLNFFVSWGLLEWAIGALGAAASAIAVWVWNLGRRIDEGNSRMDKIDARIEKGESLSGQLQGHIVRIEIKMEALGATMYELKDYLSKELRDLPSRVFIESQIQQISERIDGVVDAKVGRRLSSRDS